MIKRELRHTRAGVTVLLSDSVSYLTDEDRGRIVVCASHGGQSSGEYARECRPDLIFFNDAGVGKDDAGIRALELLEEIGVAACAVSHMSARIGDVLDHWESGVVSHSNPSAAGIEPGCSVVNAVERWASA